MEASLAALIGRNIRRARGEMPNRPNTRQFAEILKDLDPRRAPNHQRVSDWERGVQKPSDDYMQLIVQVTGKPLDWFYREHGEEEATPDPFASDENANGYDSEIRAQLARLEDMLAWLVLAEIEATAEATGASETERPPDALGRDLSADLPTPENQQQEPNHGEEEKRQDDAG